MAKIGKAEQAKTLRKLRSMPAFRRNKIRYELFAKSFKALARRPGKIKRKKE